MTKYQAIFDALKDARLYSAQTGNVVLLSAVLHAETMSDIEIGPVDWLNADSADDAIMKAIFSCTELVKQ
jgi:hypothetical protein